MTLLERLHYVLLFVFFFSPTLCLAQILEELKKGKEDIPIVIDADQAIVCDETQHKCTATGNAKAQNGNSIVYGDILTVYFTEGKQRDISVVTADGNVRMETPNETAYGQHAHYDVALDRVIMTGGNLQIVTPKETLTARDSIEYWHKENKGVAKGKAVAQFPEKGQYAQADLMVAYFAPSGETNEEGEEKMSVDKVLLSGGDLKIVTPKETLTANDSIEYYHTLNKGIARGKAIARFKEKDQLVAADTLTAYFIPGPDKTADGKSKMKIDRIEAVGNVLASGPDGIVTGDRGTYLEDADLVEVFDNVKITQEGNVIEGGYAKANLKTNVAELYTTPPSLEQPCQSKRVSGIILPKDLKKRKGGQIFPKSANKGADQSQSSQ